MLDFEPGIDHAWEILKDPGCGGLGDDPAGRVIQNGEGIAVIGTADGIEFNPIHLGLVCIISAAVEGM